MNTNTSNLDEFLDSNGLLDQEKFFKFVTEAFNEANETEKLKIIQSLNMLISVKKERLKEKELKKEQLEN